MEKTIKMKPENGDKERKELSYEQLKEVANQLASQNNMLQSRLNELSNNMMLTRLDFLIRIIELLTKGANGFSEEFVKNVYKEIEFALRPLEEENGGDNGTNQSNNKAV